MNQRMLKGSKALPETDQFAIDFPVPLKGEPDMILTTDEFDKWADDNGYYSLDCEGATLLMERNNLRKRINLTASSEAWLALGALPYSVDVRDHGKTYQVRRSEDSFALRADRLPGQVRQYATTKRENIQRLLGSIDIRNLPPIVQMRVGSLDREVERYLRGIEHQTAELNREYDALRLQLKMMVDSGMIASEDGALTALTGPEITPAE